MPDRPATVPTTRTSQTPRGPDPIAGLAAAVFPGLGHLVRGRTRRGILAMVGVMGLFLYGLFVGGIDAVDSREDRIWFFGAALVGPTTFAVDWVHQNRFKAWDPDLTRVRTGNPGEVRDADAGGRAVWRRATPAELEAGMGPPNGKGLGRLNEIAMLSIALAGMLNLIVFLDALLPTRGEPGRVSRTGVGIGQTVVEGAAATAEGGAS